MNLKIEEYTIPRVIGVKQAAAEFGIAEYTLRTWIKTGQLPVVRCGRKHLVNCTILSRFLAGKPLPEAQHIEQSRPAAVGADGTLYTTAAGYKTRKTDSGKMYRVMPPIY